MKCFDFIPTGLGESINVVSVSTKAIAGAIVHTEEPEGFRWEFVPTTDFQVSFTVNELEEICSKIDVKEKDWRAGRVKQIISEWSKEQMKKPEFDNFELEELARQWKFQSATVRAIWLEVKTERK